MSDNQASSVIFVALVAIMRPIRHNGCCQNMQDLILSGRRGRRTANNGGSECLALTQEVYFTCTLPLQPSAHILSGRSGLLWVPRNNWNGKLSPQHLEPTAPKSIGWRNRVVEQNWPHHFEAGHTCATRSPKKPLKARMVRAGPIPLNWASFIPPLTTPALSWFLKIAFGMPMSKPAVTHQPSTTSCR